MICAGLITGLKVRFQSSSSSSLVFLCCFPPPSVLPAVLFSFVVFHRCLFHPSSWLSFCFPRPFYRLFLIFLSVCVIMFHLVALHMLEDRHARTLTRRWVIQQTETHSLILSKTDTNNSPSERGPVRICGCTWLGEIKMPEFVKEGWDLPGEDVRWPPGGVS